MLTGPDMASRLEDRVWRRCKALAHSNPYSQTKILQKLKSTSYNQLCCCTDILIVSGAYLNHVSVRSNFSDEKITIFGWVGNNVSNEIIRISVGEGRPWKACSEFSCKDSSCLIESPDVAVDELYAATIWAFIDEELRGNAAQWAYTKEEDLACPK